MDNPCFLFCFASLGLYQHNLMNKCYLFIHVLWHCLIGTAAIALLPECQWNKPEEYGRNRPKSIHNPTITQNNKTLTVCMITLIIYVLNFTILIIIFWRSGCLTPRISYWCVCMHTAQGKVSHPRTMCSYSGVYMIVANKLTFHWNMFLRF